LCIFRPGISGEENTLCIFPSGVSGEENTLFRRHFEFEAAVDDTASLFFSMGHPKNKKPFGN
jgi:hypothetical protein